MGAPLRNTNGEKGWFSPIADEPTEKVQTRIPRSQFKQMVDCLRDGETQSQFVREAIATELQRRSVERNQQSNQNSQNN